MPRRATGRLFYYIGAPDEGTRTDRYSGRMPRSRDRHGRGIRGPLALPHAFSSSAVPLHRPNRSEFFTECVTDAIAAVAAVSPRAFDGILVGVEDVPQWSPTLSADRVPMSAAL